MGIAVSKKVGKSVVRNRLKRLIREVYRKNRNLFPAATDLVIIPKRMQGKLSYQRLVDEIAKLARRRRA